MERLEWRERGVGLVNDIAESAADEPPANWPVGRTPMDLPPGRQENLIWHDSWRPGLSLTTDLASFGFVGANCHAVTAFEHRYAPEHALLGTDGLYRSSYRHAPHVP